MNPAKTYHRWRPRREDENTTSSWSKATIICSSSIEAMSTTKLEQRQRISAVEYVGIRQPHNSSNSGIRRKMLVETWTTRAAAKVLRATACGGSPNYEYCVGAMVWWNASQSAMLT